MKMTEEEQYIKDDRLMYTKNKASSNLAILAILFDVFYFVSLYKSDVGSYYYNILIGASIVYNLLFMLAAFLSSEGAKNYKPEYSGVMVLIGVLQLVRIFILPMRAHKAVVSIAGVERIAMGNAQFTRIVIYLVLSAVCLIAAGVVNYRKCSAIKAHMKLVEEAKA